MKHYSKYFYGEKISDYGLEKGYVDYRTLAKTFDCVLNNNIIQETYDIGYWEQESGIVDNADEIEEIEEKIENNVNEIEEIVEKIEEIVEKIEDLMLEDADENREEIERLGAKKEELEEEKEELEEEQKELEEEKEELEEEQENSYNAEIFQYYIVSDNGAEILKEIDEIVFYNDRLDMYVWGVTHWGTSWDYVLTDIKIVLDEE